MNNADFEKVLQDTVNKVESVLSKKADEYSRGDRLHNFKVAAAMANTTPEMALRGMLAKHIVSVWDLIDDAEKRVYADAALWDEKIIDSINYLILLRAMVVEQNCDCAKECW